MENGSDIKEVTFVVLQPLKTDDCVAHGSFTPRKEQTQHPADATARYLASRLWGFLFVRFW